MQQKSSFILSVLTSLLLNISTVFAEGKLTEHFKGNVIELKMENTDTAYVIDPVAEQQRLCIVKSVFPVPERINGKPIAAVYEMSDKITFKDGSEDMEQYLFNAVRPEMNKLKDGVYRINVYNLVIDTDGKIAYYKIAGVKRYDKKRKILSAAFKKAIDLKTAEALDELQLTPRMEKGQPVIARLAGTAFEPQLILKVKKHETYWK